MGPLAFVTTVARAQNSYGDIGGLHCILNNGNGAITGGTTFSSGTASTCNASSGWPLPQDAALTFRQRAAIYPSSLFLTYVNVGSNLDVFLAGSSSLHKTKRRTFVGHVTTGSRS
jgi:hypothetical protein